MDSLASAQDWKRLEMALKSIGIEPPQMGQIQREWVPELANRLEHLATRVEDALRVIAAMRTNDTDEMAHKLAATAALEAKVMDSMTRGNILDLRFIDRQGKRILQACYSARVEFGEVVYDWEDVRMEEEE